MGGQTYPFDVPFGSLARETILQGPGQFVFTGEDALQIDSLSSLAGLVLTITGTMLGEGGLLIPFAFTHVPNSNRTVATTRVSIDSGWLQQVRVVVSTGAPLIGQCWVAVRRSRGLTAIALTTATIQTQYVTATTDLYWPGAQAQLPLDGEGAALRQAVTTPGAGADWTITVPTGARWELIAASGLFTAAVAAANRQPELIIDDGANIVFAAPTQTNITTGQVSRVSWGAGAGGPLAGVNLDQSLPIPNDLYLPAGFRIRSNTPNINAGDTWTAINVFTREWLEGN